MLEVIFKAIVTLLLSHQHHQLQHHNEINIRVVSPNESLEVYRIDIIRSTVHLNMRDIRPKRHQLPRDPLIQVNLPVSTVWPEVKASEKLREQFVLSYKSVDLSRPPGLILCRLNRESQ
jgi:hypothetical protein